MLIMLIGNLRYVKNQYSQSNQEKNICAENDGTSDVANTAAKTDAAKYDDVNKGDHTDDGKALAIANTVNHVAFRDSNHCKNTND